MDRIGPVRSSRMPSYTDEQKRRAVDMIEECGGSVTRAMRRLGYSTRHKSSATFSFGKRS